MAYRVDGFIFQTEEEAAQAQKEAAVIAQLGPKLKTARPQTVLALYRQMLEKNLFQTSLGLAFMRQVRAQLAEEESLAGEDIPAVPGEETETRIRTPRRRSNAEANAQLASYAKKLTFYRSLCIAMLLIIIGMFYITSTSSQPTIINYEQQLVNKYASWAQELEEREQAVLEREQALNQD